MAARAGGVEPPLEFSEPAVHTPPTTRTAPFRLPCGRRQERMGEMLKRIVFTALAAATTPAFELEWPYIPCPLSLKPATPRPLELEAPYTPVAVPEVELVSPSTAGAVPLDERHRRARLQLERGGSAGPGVASASGAARA